MDRARLERWLAARVPGAHLLRPEPQTFLLHFGGVHWRAQHLLWFADDPQLTVCTLAIGGGPGLVTAFLDRQIPFEIVWAEAGTLAMSQELRRIHNNRRLCPRCCYGRARQLPLFPHHDWRKEPA